MDLQIITLKNTIEKLQRECFEKFSEIEVLKKENCELKKNKKIGLSILRNDTSDILVNGDSYPAPGETFQFSPNHTSRLQPNLIFHTTAHLTKLASLKKMYQGDFVYKEIPSCFIPHSRWEFVIVCPNPDSDIKRPFINSTDAEKIFRKGFKAEFSKKIQNYRLNQQTEKKAFAEVFETLPFVDEKENKKFGNGGRFKKEVGSVVIDTKGPVRDFLSLMRNILLMKLGIHLGLHTKQIMSSNGKYIYILVCADEDDLKNEAEAINYNLQMEIGQIDLPSLEPCDEKLRPYRLLDIPHEAAKALQQSIKEEFPEIMDLFKTTETEENVLEPHESYYFIWDTYLEYLKIFGKSLRELAQHKLDPVNRNYCLQKIMKKCKEQANLGKKKDHQLKDMWDRMGFSKPLSPYFDFIRNIDPRTKQDKFLHIWKKYDLPYVSEQSIFRATDRLKILNYLIQRQTDLHYLAQKEVITCYFPLKTDFELLGLKSFTNILEDPHSEIVSKKVLKAIYGPSPKGLLNYWGKKLTCSDLPINRIRNYFGEKIGLYFAFISFFSRFLALPSLIGVIVFVIQRIYDSADTRIVGFNVFYCIYVSCWGTSFIEFWKRKESTISIRWGQTDYEEDEVPRPQFHGQIQRSPIDDDMEDIYYNPLSRYKLFLISGLVTILFIAVVVTAVILILYLKVFLSDILTWHNTDFSGVVCSTINAIQIQFFNLIFNRIAVKLNNFENHRTQSDYENSLIIKSYGFQFVNSFFSLFYIAFFKTKVQGCSVSTPNGSKNEIGAPCVNELYTQFITIFTVSFLKNFLELGGPYIQSKMKGKEFFKTASEQAFLRSQASRTELDSLRDQIDKQIQLPAYITKDVDGTLGDYLELAILYGYITLFAVAFPLSGILAFFAVFVEIQVDRFKLLNMVRRPVPLGAKDISSWKFIFIFNSIASILTNAALICFTLPTFDNFPKAQENNYLIFSIFSCAMLLIRTAVAFGIPDVPLKYNLISKRHKRLIQRFIKGWEITKSSNKSGDLYINPNIYFTYRENEAGES